MAYQLDPDLEYFLGITLPKPEATELAQLRQRLENRVNLSSPPHITLKRPFTYHFAKPLTEQLEKWSRQQVPFTAILKKVGSFSHKKDATVVLLPEKGQPFRRLEQSLSQTIRFLPDQENFTPHLTIANRITHDQLPQVKQQIRSLKLEVKFVIDNLTLFTHHRFQPWEINAVYRFQQPVTKH